MALARKSTRRVTRKRQPSAKTSTRPTRAFRKKVQSIVTRMAEKKETHASSLNIPLSSYDQTQVGTMVKVIPLLGRGDGQDDREGNEVTFNSIHVRGSLSMLTLLEDADSAKPTHIRMMVVSQKKNTIVSTVAGAFPTFTEVNTLFQDVNGGQGFQGNILDMHRSVNKNAWTLHHQKLFKLGRNDGVYANNDYKLQRDFSYRVPKKMLGKVMYNDGTSTPTNKQYFIFFQVVGFDGSTYGTNFGPCELSYIHSTTFTDL